MKLPLFLISPLLWACTPSKAQTASKVFNPAPTSPSYLSESPLPQGWPAPGPFDEVARKKYPASRAAFTPSSSPNGGFWTLFKHIKRNGIPMTSPVEMAMKDEAGGSLKMQQMGFLYQSPAVGKVGTDAEGVMVRDIPEVNVLSYTWQGPRNDATVAKARTAIEAAMTAKGLKSSGYRLLGYNSPMVSQKKQTHELQALLK
jgi:hypothetical protein